MDVEQGMGRIRRYDQDEVENYKSGKLQPPKCFRLNFPIPVLDHGHEHDDDKPANGPVDDREGAS